MKRAAWTSILAAALSGCIQGPHVPKDGSPDTYSWRAPIDVEGSEPVYRFDLGPDIQGALAKEDIGSPAVFDAHGTPQACGTFGNGPIESTVTLAHARVSEFAPDMCAKYGNPPVCFKNHDCEVSDICPRTRIDLTRSTALAHIDALPDLIAIANAPPDACDLDRSSPCQEIGLDDPIHSEQRVMRREARSALRGAHLDEVLTPDPPPTTRHSAGVWNPGSGEAAGAGGGIRGRLGGAILSGPGSSAGRIDGPVPLATPGSAADRWADPNAGPPDDDSGGYVVEFDEPATEIRLYWSPPIGGQIGTTTLSAYDAEGHRHEHTDSLQPFGGKLADRFEQVVWLDTHPKAVRVTVQSSVPDLRLVSATSTNREHKPFVDTHLRQYWFAVEGTAPYAIYFERGHGTCGYSEDPRRVAAYPRLNDPAWPPAATVGVPLRNPRGVFATLATSQFGVLVWLAWLGLMFGLWLACAVLVGARGWLLRGARPQRRS